MPTLHARELDLSITQCMEHQHTIKHTHLMTVNKNALKEENQSAMKLHGPYQYAEWSLESVEWSLDIDQKETIFIS